MDRETTINMELPGKRVKPKLGSIIKHNQKSEQKKIVQITYQKKNGRTVKRKIEPYNMKNKNLVIAYDLKRKAVRSFLKDRILSMEKVAFWDGFTDSAKKTLMVAPSLADDVLIYKPRVQKLLDSLKPKDEKKNGK